MEHETGNLVQLVCDLSEASDQVFRRSDIPSWWHSGLQSLARLRAIESGPRPGTVTCKGCDDDHPAVIEYDPSRRCYIHFCRWVGFVTLKHADLVTDRFRPEWLVDWLTKVLSISSPIRRPALVPNHVWHLGDAAIGDTQATVIFARRLSNLADLDRLASALRPIHPADKGLVITTSRHVARHVQLPGGYELLPFPEIVQPEGGGLALDVVRLGSWVKGIPASTKKGVSRAGRPSLAARIRQLYDARRQKGAPVISILAEAKAILGMLKQSDADSKLPHISTVRRHVSRLRVTPAPG